MIYDAYMSALKAGLIYDCLHFSSLGPILGKGSNGEYGLYLCGGDTPGDSIACHVKLDIALGQGGQHC